jgi:hypothetical protein
VCRSSAIYVHDDTDTFISGLSQDKDMTAATEIDCEKSDSISVKENYFSVHEIRFQKTNLALCRTSREKT